MKCASCQREVFYLGRSVITGEPQFICSACGHRHCGHIAGMTIIDPDAGFYLAAETEDSARK